MMKSFFYLLLFFTGSFLLAPKPVHADTTFVKFGSNWQYLDDGTNQEATNWTTGSLAWPSGPAQLGYGEGNERTVVGYGSDPSSKYVTTYFRSSVNIASPSSFTSFIFNLYLDDAAIIYVNGTQAVKTNLPATVTYTTLATAAAADNGHVIQAFSVPTGSFNPGTNVIAVEVHQSSVSNAAIVFDLELKGIGNPAEQAISRGPLLQMLNGTGITLKWKTASATTSRIKYGTSESSLTGTVSDNTKVTDHELRINGLAPDTRYYYAAGSASSIIEGSYRNAFTTAPPATSARKIRIAVFGDAGTGTAIQKGVRDGYLRLSKGGTPDLALLLGDNAYNNGTDAQHQTNCFDIYDDNIFNNHPVYSVPGNHEYDNDPNGVSGLRGTHEIPYYDNFILPTAAEAGGTASGNEHYYSFDYGNIHFIMLDSYGYDNNKLLYDSTGQQALWLKNDLAVTAGSHKWTMVCLHHPPYTHGTHNSDSESDLVAIRQQITPILERFGVDVVMAGHSHVYERSFLVNNHTGLSGTFTAANTVNGSSARYDGTTNSCPYFTIDSVYKHGTVYITAGSAGQIGAAGNAQFPVFYYKNYSGDAGGESGALYLEVEDNRLDAKFVGQSGTVHDAFTIMKGVNRNTVVEAVVNSPAILSASWIGGYNWYTAPPGSISQGTSRAITVSQPAAGNYTYLVNDSLTPKTTCMADTFTLRVTSVLAVAITGYTATVGNTSVKISWTTTQEINSDFFAIERSANGGEYETIMVMPAKGNAAAPTHYEFTDNNPLEGISYYRLSATDKDGDRKVAGTRSVNHKILPSFSFSIQPNPVVNNQVNTVMQTAKKQLLKIKAFDLNGTEIYASQLTAPAGSSAVNFRLNPGPYVIRIQSQDGSEQSRKVVVQ